MTRVGAVDCGTNSIRLLIADIDDGALTDVERTMRIVRLGQGVDVSGRIAPEAMTRTLAAATDYATTCAELGVERVRFVATSASRDAENSADFVAGVRDAFSRFGTTPEVVAGSEEASLSFRGATGDLIANGAAAPYLVVDLGGGSTEFVRGTRDVEQALSLNIGCVRMTERHLRSDPPTPAEIEAALVDINAAIDEAEAAVGFAGIGSLVGLAGSITTVTAHALGLAVYDSAQIHGATLTADRVTASCDAILHSSREQRAALPFMHPGRVDVIGAGSQIWRTIAQRVTAKSPDATIITSEKDILDGIALSIA
ncbi:Ppx/GppA phosphatase family protein [Calidifontibacter terrae]